MLSRGDAASALKMEVLTAVNSAYVRGLTDQEIKAVIIAALLQREA